MSENATTQTPSTSPEQPAVLKPAYNTAAIKRQALRVSRETRNGKFTRVTKSFVDDVIAEIENKLRQLEAPLNSALKTVETSENFLTGKGKTRLVEAFNKFVAREIQRKADNVRVGKSL